MEYHFTGMIESNLESVSDLVSRIVEDLSTLLDASLLFDVRLILSELLINGCDHGNHYDPKKKVLLNLELEDDEIRITVRDQGAGICYRTEDYNPKSLKSTGRGLKLVEGLSDEMRLQDNKVYCVLYKEK